MSLVQPSKSFGNSQSDLLPTAHLALTLSSDVDLTASFTPYARQLYVGTGGNVVCRMQNSGGVDVTYKNVPSGSYLYGAFIKVASTGNGTTAADIVAEQ